MESSEAGATASVTFCHHQLKSFPRLPLFANTFAVMSGTLLEQTRAAHEECERQVRSQIAIPARVAFREPSHG